jgi:16S rRNA (guanine(1405)-N(7))-methyltransferase
MTTLDNLVAAVRRSPKYRSVSDEVISGIGARLLARGVGLREAIKDTKGKLHQVGAAYLTGRLPYDEWLILLERASGSGDTEVRSVCRQLMSRHASTRERLPILERFFVEALAPLTPIRSVLDVACGLNPLAIPWMPVAPEVRYCGCDMYTDMVEFLNAALPLLGAEGQIVACDVTQSLPADSADVALVLKSLPCIEQLAPSSSTELLRKIRSDVLLVSYPVRSLGGSDKGMLRNYEQQFRRAADGEGWAVQRLTFETELAFVVRKNPT